MIKKPIEKRILLICSTVSGGAFSMTRTIAFSLKEYSDFDVDILSPNSNDIHFIVRFILKMEMFIINVFIKYFRLKKTNHENYFFDLPMSSLTARLWLYFNARNYKFIISMWRSFFVSNKTLNNIINNDHILIAYHTDMAWFTGGCHFSGDCTLYNQDCKACQAVPNYLRKYVERNYHQKHELAKNVYSIVPNQFVFNFSKRYDIAFKDSRICYFPINSVFLRNVSKPTQKSKTFVFLSTTIADPRKGLELYLDALKLLGDKKLLIGVKLVFVGHGASSNTDILKLDGVGDITCYEYLEPVELSKLYNNSTAFISLPNQDMGPTSVFESISALCPVITSDVGIGPELVENGSGFTVHGRDPQAVADQINRMIMLKEEEYSILIENCIKERTKFTQSYFSKKFIEYLSELA